MREGIRGHEVVLMIATFQNGAKAYPLVPDVAMI